MGNADGITNGTAAGTTVGPVAGVCDDAAAGGSSVRVPATAGGVALSVPDCGSLKRNGST